MRARQTRGRGALRRLALAALGVLTLSCRVAPPEAPDAGDAAGPADRATDLPLADGASRGCDLVAQTCPALSACYPDNAFSGATVCDAPGTGGPLTPCLLHDRQDCDRGLACIDIAGDGFRVCAELCAVAGAVGCPPGGPCQPIAGYQGVGFCVP